MKAAGCSRVALALLAASGCRSPAPTDRGPTDSAARPGAAAPSAAPPVRSASPAAAAAPPVRETPKVLYLPDAAPSRVESRRAYRVAALGDSLTDRRVGGGLYLARLQELCPESRFDHFGKGGDMVNQMRRRLPAVFAAASSPETRYTHLVVFGGVNDLYSDLTAGRTVRKITADLEAIYDEARAQGLAVVAITVAPWGGFSRWFTPARAETTRELNAWIRARPAAGTVAHVVDAHELLGCGDSLCEAYSKPHRDGLHFGPEGHRRLGEALHRTAFPDCR